ncbi:hypothetical protein P8452_64309 [Trifolium repens]|nr:hypothetical protein P8452_64309 [Trifolium repens]
MLPLVVVPQLPRSSLEEEVRTLSASALRHNVSVIAAVFCLLKSLRGIWYVDSEKRFQNVLEACGVFKSRETWCKRRRQSDCWIDKLSSDSAKGPEWK